ncbi:MAG: energy transducer TonB [Acidobacteriales bacterium]|nr:energy transducer TonB [Terriglobales bacterium]
MSQLLVGLIVLAGVNVPAQTTPLQPREIEAALNKRFKDQVVTLRVFYPDKELHLSSDGQYKGKNQQGSWTLWSKIKIDAIEVTARRLVIRGQRYYVAYHTEKGRFINIASRDNAAIFIDFGSTPVTPESVQSALENVALKKEERLSDIVPTEWQGVLRADERGDPIPSPKSVQGPAKVGEGVRAPRVLSAPDPTYGKEARKAKLEGRVVLWVVLNPDGRIGEVRIVKPLGMGLDERAVDAVRTWRFEPAKRDGVPVPVQINIEVNYRLW